MAGLKVSISLLLFQLCCSPQNIFATDDPWSSELQRRIEALEKQDAERSAVNLRQQQLIEEQAKQLKRTNDLVANLSDIVVDQASEIATQRNKIENLNQHVLELSAHVKEREDVAELLTTGIAVLKNDLKACTVSNTELSEQVKALNLLTPEHLLANVQTGEMGEKTERISNKHSGASSSTIKPNTETKSGENYVTRSDSVQRSSRFVNQPVDGPFAFHAVSDKHQISHIMGGQSIIFENVLLNIGRALHTNHSLFIAEMPGIYLFSASILSFVNDHSEFTAALVKNGGNLALVYGHGDAGRHDQGSATVVTQLNVGDEVWVKLLSPADTSIYGGRYTTFSGVLLYSLL